MYNFALTLPFNFIILSELAVLCAHIYSYSCLETNLFSVQEQVTTIVVVAEVGTRAMDNRIVELISTVLEVVIATGTEEITVAAAK